MSPEVLIRSLKFHFLNFDGTSKKCEQGLKQSVTVQRGDREIEAQQ